MVKTKCPLSKEQIKLLINTTNFTRSQLLAIYKKFYQLAPDLVPTDMSIRGALSVTVPQDLIVKSFPELEFNPFVDRILYIFSYWQV